MAAHVRLPADLFWGCTPLQSVALSQHHAPQRGEGVGGGGGVLQLCVYRMSPPSLHLPLPPHGAKKLVLAAVFELTL